jgi:hypothetical protein
VIGGANEDGSIDRLAITALTRPNSYRKIVGLESKLKIHPVIESATCTFLNVRKMSNGNK